MKKNIYVINRYQYLVMLTCKCTMLSLHGTVNRIDPSGLEVLAVLLVTKDNKINSSTGMRKIVLRI